MGGLNRTLGLLLVALLLLTACGEEASVNFGAGDSGGTEGQATPGDQPAGQPDADDEDTAADGTTSPDQPVSSDGSTAAPSTPSSKATSGAVKGSRGSAGSGQSVAPGEPGTGAPDCPDCATQEPPGGPPPGSGQPDNGPVTPRPGQENVRARPWESAEVQADDVTVHVSYWTGVEPCHVLDRVEVRETASMVTITLYEGSQPGFDGGCTAQAVQRWTRVTLSAPLAGRMIVDGAAGK